MATGGLASATISACAGFAALSGSSLATQLQWDLIWFGIIVVIVLEMGMISPPVGINVFVVKSIAPEVPMRTIFRGIWPFWFAMAAMIALLVAFPGIAMFLPDTMLGS